MEPTSPFIFIICGKHMQKVIRDYFIDYNFQNLLYFNSAEEIEIPGNTGEPALFIVEMNSAQSIPSKFVTQYKQKASRKETPVLYLTDNSIQNFQFKPGSNQGIYDILQWPVPQEVFLNKIKLFLQFQKRTEQLTKEIEEHIKTKIDLQNKVNKIDETSSFLELLIEGIPLPVFIKNEKGEYIKCNKAFEKFTERPKGNIFGKKIFDITVHKIADKINRNDMEIIKSGQGAIHEEIFRKMDGSVINIIVHKNVFFNEQNNTRGIIGTIFDITEIKRTEKLLKIQHTIDYLASMKTGMLAALKNILDQLLELEWVDGGGIYIYNREKEEAKLVCSSGLSEEFNKSVKVYKKDSPQLKFLLKKKPLYGSYHKIAAEKKFKEKEENFNLLAIIPMVKPENDELVGSLNLISRKHGEITKQEKSDLEFIVKSLVSLITYAQSQEELKELNKRLKKTIKEQQDHHQYLIQKSKLESLGELSAGIAHEINQPLGILSLSIENLHAKISSDNISPEYLTNKFHSIESNIDRIREIIEHIKTFSRDQDIPTLDKISVNKIIHKALSLIRAQYNNRNINIKLDLKKDMQFTVGNKFKLEQAILNLLSNAKYAVEDKAVYFSENEYSKEIIIKTESFEKEILLSIEDNGAGIKQEFIERIFDPFYTTKPEGIGTGLGLSIVYGIVKDMFGEIKVNSEEGEFTKFELFFPRFPEKD